MFQTRIDAANATPPAGIVAMQLAADLGAIARIESSLGHRIRRRPLQGRPDFSRLMRHIPTLKV